MPFDKGHKFGSLLHFLSLNFLARTIIKQKPAKCEWAQTVAAKLDKNFNI
jgi:hypothetical protein